MNDQNLEQVAHAAGINAAREIARELQNGSKDVDKVCRQLRIINIMLNCAILAYLIMAH